MSALPTTDTIKPADLRGILKYVPRFRDQVFVIALDGSIIADENLPNLFLDIAVLRSLNIGVVLVHGIGRQLQDLSESRGISISDVHGIGVTDAATRDLAIEASARVSHCVMEGLTQSGLKCALSNAVRAAPVGIVKGNDHQYTGKVERIDHTLLRSLMVPQMVPVIAPILFDREGKSLRVNSDHLATELAIALNASKVMFLGPYSGLEIDGKIKRQISGDELEKILRVNPESIQPNVLSKARHAVKAIHGGPPRVHFVDGRIYEGLLTEVFSNEGIGTLIYGNDYQQIRPATRRDARTIHNLTRQAVKKEELARRSLQTIEKNIDQFYVFEIDEYAVACVALRFYEEEYLAEIGSLYVQPSHQRAGIGLKMVKFACREAKSRGAKSVLALTTQSFTFFRSVCGFEEGSKELLPPARLALYEKNNRQSRILVKHLDRED